MERRDHFDLGSQHGYAPLAAGASAYARGMGLVRPSSFRNTLIDPEHAKAIAKEYEAAPAYESSAVPHFRAMAEETKRQFEFLTSARKHGGLGLNVEVTSEDPYSGPREMFDDVRQNNRLRVMGTHVTGSHPLFADDVNDQFRAVHDAFGHAATGRGFDRHGEEAAFRSHYSMFSSLAKPAMATETRGQNAALNYGSTPGEFAEQKIALLGSAQRVAPIGRRGNMIASAEQARGSNVRQFGSLAFRQLRG